MRERGLGFRGGMSEYLSGHGKKARWRKDVWGGVSVFMCAFLLFAMFVVPAASHEKLASEEDYNTLKIYGNANGDDTIDMRDVTYIKLVIFGKKPETEFCDANYDGKISMLDVVQTKLIIVGKEGKLTLKDGADRVVTVEMPVKRFIPTDYRTTEAMLAIGAKDLIVGVDKAFHERMSEFDLEALPEVSEHAKFIDYEQVLLLDPDLVVLPTWQAEDAEDVAEHLPGIPVIVMGCTKRRTIIPDIRTMGILLGCGEKAEELINWINKYDGIVEERTKELKEEEKPKFYYEYMAATKKYWAITPEDPSAGQVVEGCGGRNIAEGLPGTKVEVDPEWVLKQNPDVIFMDLMKGFDSGPGKTPEDMEELLQRLLSERPELSNTNAVKNGRVYLIDRDIVTGPRWVIGHMWFAKWLHPELFKDINPDEIHEEYLMKFHGISVEGTWAYPPPPDP